MVNNIIDNISKKANENNTNNNNDYYKDELLYCGDCNTQKQLIIFVFGSNKKVNCICKCRQEMLEKEEKRFKRQRELSRIRELKSNGIQDKKALTYTFSNDDGKKIKLTNTLKRYVFKWDEIYKSNIGLLLYGDVGTGKTFYAGCIANALINKGISVLMTSFGKIINDLTNIDVNKNKYIDNLLEYKLLIIDDLGVERQTDFILEQVYAIIDARYKSDKPLIITTNLNIEEIKNPNDLRKKRIYDRILEKCTPILVDGINRRIEKCKTNIANAKEIFD